MGGAVHVPRRVGHDWLGIAGLSVVGAAVAILSFAALSDLAERFGIDGRIQLPDGLGWFQLAWLIPIAVDVFAVMATRVWLQGRAGEAALAFARRAAWAAIATSILGNGAHGALIAYEQGRPLWWVLAAVVVSAVPAVGLGALVHLVWLAMIDPDVPTADAPHADVHDRAEDDGPAGETREQKRERLLHAGAGRRRLARELGISEHEARLLLERHTTEGAA